VTCLIFSHLCSCVSFRLVPRSRNAFRLSSILTDLSSPLSCLCLGRPFCLPTHSNSRYGADDEDAAHEAPPAAHLPAVQPAERPPVIPLEQMGANALTISLADFLFGDGPDPDRSNFERKAAAGMRRHVLRGHTVDGSSMAISSVVKLILSEWGPQGGPHPEFDDLPAGLRDSVAAWVASRR